MNREKNRGIIDYSPPDQLDSAEIKTNNYTLDGTAVYKEEAAPEIEREFIGFDSFTVSYHGLIKSIAYNELDYVGRTLPHISIFTHELDTGVSENLIKGQYLPYRQFPDSLKNLLNDENGHSMGYAAMTRYESRGSVKNDISKFDGFYVERGVGNLSTRSILTDFIADEVSREDGQFISKGSLDKEYFDGILSSDNFVTSYSIEDDLVQSLVILSDSPGNLPWFNEERIEKLSIDMGKKYSDVKLAFLALTTPELRRKRIAPVLFDLAFNELENPGREFILCTECSPRSISYTPYLMSRQLNKKYITKETITERTVAHVYPMSNL